MTIENISAPHAPMKLALAAAGTPYSIHITMSPDTVTALLGGNYNLFGFKAVATTAVGAPLVWFKSKNYSASTDVKWTEQYQAYTSTDEIIPNGEIDASFAADATLGQELEVGAGGVGPVVQGSVPNAISIRNTTSAPFTCGISQLQAGVTAPICAFPLYGNGLDVVIPVEKVLLTFSTTPVDTGTVIEQAYSQGVLIDLTGVTSRQVTFDINKGWSWGGFAWAQTVDANANLVPLLVESSVALAQRRA